MLHSPPARARKEPNLTPIQLTLLLPFTKGVERSRNESGLVAPPNRTPESTFRHHVGKKETKKMTPKYWRDPGRFARRGGRGSEAQPGATPPSSDSRGWGQRGELQSGRREAGARVITLRGRLCSTAPCSTGVELTMPVPTSEEGKGKDGTLTPV